MFCPTINDSHTPVCNVMPRFFNLSRRCFTNLSTISSYNTFNMSKSTPPFHALNGTLLRTSISGFPHSSKFSCYRTAEVLRHEMCGEKICSLQGLSQNLQRYLTACITRTACVSTLTSAGNYFLYHNVHSGLDDGTEHCRSCWCKFTFWGPLSGRTNSRVIQSFLRVCVCPNNKLWTK